jgi:hypothetical protein
MQQAQLGPVRTLTLPHDGPMTVLIDLRPSTTWNHGSCAVTLSMVCGSGVLTTPSRWVRDKSVVKHSRRNAANRERKGRKHLSEHRFANIGIRTATIKDEVNTHNARKGLSLTMRASSSDKELSQTY